MTTHGHGSKAAPAPAPAPQEPKLDFNDTKQAFEGVSNGQLRQMAWLFRAIGNPTLTSVNAAITPTLVKYLPPVRAMVRATAFRQFCGGETIEDCARSIEALASRGVGTILDYSVEGKGTAASRAATEQEIIDTIRYAAAHKDQIPYAVFKLTGVMEAVRLRTPGQLTIKHYEAVSRICQTAADQGVRLFIDAEETWYQTAIDQIALEMMMRHNQSRPIVYNTYQLYLRDGLERLERQALALRAQGRHLGAKLVRGAYMEKEARVALAEGRPNPINPSKAATDDLYDQAAQYCLDHLDHIGFCLGTHNESSTRRVAMALPGLGVAPGDERVWFAQLYGMSDNITRVLANAGYRTAKYMPYGPVETVMPYLIRRAQENTSVAGQTSRELSLILAELRRRRQA